MLNHAPARSCSAIIAIALTLPAAADTIRVPADQPTIRAALNAARDADTILVADGVCTGGGNKLLDFRARRITLRSENGAERCIIDCQGQGRAFRFHSGESADFALEGFTIRNGSMRNGGAILFERGSAPIVRNCIFSSNTATGTARADGGGAIRSEASSPTFVGCTFHANVATGPDNQGGGAMSSGNASRPTLLSCTFTDNHGAYGGAIVSYTDTTADLRGCTFTSNHATLVGGAVFDVDHTSSGFTDCTFRDNSAGNNSGAVLLDGPHSSVVRCTFIANQALGELPGGFGGALSVIGCDPTLTDCLFVGNSSRSGGGVQCIFASPTVANCRFIGNTALPSGNGGPPGRTPAGSLCRRCGEADGGASDARGATRPTLSVPLRSGGGYP